VEIITSFFFDKERSDFWLRLLFTDVLDLREESRYVRLIVLCLLVDFCLLVERYFPSFDRLLFSIELERDFLLGVP